jgi:hypothetical protein
VVVSLFIRQARSWRTRRSPLPPSEVERFATALATLSFALGDSAGRGKCALVSRTTHPRHMTDTSASSTVRATQSPPSVPHGFTRTVAPQLSPRSRGMG